MQIIEASRAPVVASHVGMRALCDNPANLSDDVLRALAAKNGLVGIVASADYISQPYFDWSRTHPPVPVNGVTRAQVFSAELPKVRSPNQDYGEYIDALDALMGGLWRRYYGQPWKDTPEAENLVPSAEQWADHVAHAIALAGPTRVAIGLDEAHGKSMLKNIDASGYPLLVEALSKRKISSQVHGENWLRILDAAKVQ